tara:strand:+ start:110 stop:1933 length:1824 start_codon:yes stop_codon:yes gene_type:complete
VKKFYPYLSLIISVIFVTIIWEYIKIPYDQKNLIQGEFFLKKYNPINEVLRVLTFVLTPILIFLTCYLLCLRNETYSINPYSNSFFLKKKKINFEKNQSIKNISYILLALITLEFFTIDFSTHITELDIFHEGTPLVPPVNYLFSKTLWLSTLYDYGLGGNNLGFLISKFTDHHSIGSTRFVKLLLIFFNKILIIFICRKLLVNLDFEKYTKNIFYIFLTIAVLSFIDYVEISYFPPRTCIFLLFTLFTIDTVVSNRTYFWKTFIIGNFSLFSILWWIDIGIYTNLIIVVLFIYLITQKEYLKVGYIFIGAFVAWFIFITFLPINETKEFFNQIKFITSISGYLLGIEYPQPFSSHSTRETRALLLLILSGIFVVIFNFNKKINLDYSTKFIISIFFVSSIIFFQSSIMRTDAPHIKYSSGPYMFILYFTFFYFLFNKLQNTKISILFKKISKSFALIILICFFGTINIKILNFSNIINLKNNVSSLVYAEDEKFLTDRYKNFLNYYSEVSKKDDCVQVLSDDIALPYLLKKPSCTQFFIPAHILSGWNEDKFIAQIKQSNSQYILYTSPLLWLNNKKNMPNVDSFVMKNYNFYEDFDGWKVYKKKY